MIYRYLTKWILGSALVLILAIAGVFPVASMASPVPATSTVGDSQVLAADMLEYLDLLLEFELLEDMEIFTVMDISGDTTEVSGTVAARRAGEKG